MKVEELKLTDFSGGLNNRDPADKIKPNEFQRLENYYCDENQLEKRGGMIDILNQPINPQVFTQDGNTLGLWHFDDAGPTWADSGPNGYTLSVVPSFVAPVSATGLLPVNSPKGVSFTPSTYSVDYGPVFFTISKPLDNLAAITIQGWVNINPLFSGQPIQVLRSGVFYPTSSNGAILWGSAQWSPGNLSPGGPLVTGITINRDWDSVGNRNISDPYLIFTLATKGVPGTVTTIKGPGMAMGKWIFVKATYNSFTKTMNLYINGNQVGTAAPNGGGLVDDSLATHILMGGVYNNPVYNMFNGLLDEWEVESSEVTSFPFVLPRPQLIPFVKADGTNQLIFAAGNDLYFTVGDGNITKINTVANDYNGAETFSSIADWDGKVINDNLFLSNGVDPPKCWDGVLLRPWGEGTIAMWAYENGQGSTPPSGTYSYVYTFLYGASLETGPSVLNSIVTVNGKNITLSFIPLGAPGCTGRNIYRKSSDGNYYLIRTINDNTTTFLDGAWTQGSPAGPLTDTGGDGITDGASAGQLRSGSYPIMAASVLTTKIANGPYLAINFDRIFVAGMANEPYYVRYCELLGQHVFLAASFASAKSDKGTIQGIAVFQGELQASKGGNATMVLRGSDPSQWSNLEFLHTELGCIDHFAYVLHTLPKSDSLVGFDQTMLVFPCKDGHWYRYFGYNFERVSENINGTVKNLAQSNATRLQWNEDTYNQFQFDISQSAGGTATANIANPVNSVDGLNGNPGFIQIVNQLNYIGLWGGVSGTGGGPSGYPGGHVIAICKGPAEGEFYFSTDGDNNLYRTTDNFTTIWNQAAIPGPALALAAADRIIEILYVAGIGAAGTDSIFVFTAGTGAGGTLYKLDDPTNAGNVRNWIQIAVPNLFYSVDTPWQVTDVGSSNQNVTVLQDVNLGQGGDNGIHFKDFHILGKPNALPGGNNIFLSHSQKINTALVQGAANNLKIIQMNSTAYTPLSNVLNRLPSGLSPIQDGPGFFGIRDNGDWLTDRSVGVEFFNNPSSNGFTLQYMRRETPFWNGGTFRPQALWDGTNLVFTASYGVDANTGRANSAIYFVTPSNANTVTAISVGIYGYYALAFDGANIWFTIQFFDPAKNGFQPFLGKVTIGGFTLVNNLPHNYLGLRLAWNANNNTLYQSGKWFYNDKDSFNYKGYLATLSTNGFFTQIKTYTAAADDSALLGTAIADATAAASAAATAAAGVYSAANYTASATAYTALAAAWNAINTLAAYNAGVLATAAATAATTAAGAGARGAATTAADNAATAANASNLLAEPNSHAGAFPVELVAQTDFPNAMFVSLTNTLAPDTQAIDQISTGNQVTPLVANTFNGGKGIRSNLLFVPFSGASGSNLWADRLYWSNWVPQAGLDDGYMVQLGVPGNWTVIGTFTSDKKSLGVFNSFENFQAGFGGAVAFSMANASSAGGLSTFVPVVPNQNITVFPNPQSFAQWKAVLTWTYASNNLLSPSVDFVNISYFLGLKNIPRIVGQYFQGRSYWAISNAGDTVNTLVAVLQKNMTWTSFTGWNISALAKFRDKLVGFNNYGLVQLLTGPKDLGALVKGVAVFGNHMGENMDKLLMDVLVMLKQWNNNVNPNANGFLKLLPYQSGIALPQAAWAITVPAVTGTPMGQQSRAVLDGANFPYNWIRNFSFALMTSDDASGNFVPSVEQVEIVSQMILHVATSEAEYLNPVL